LAKRILSVSFLEDAYQFMEIDKQAGGFFAQLPTAVSTEEAMITACREAKEIYICGGFPTAFYQWETFAKVAKKYLAALVQQNAKEQIGTSVEPQVQYKYLEDVVQTGITKSKLAYIAIPDPDLEPIWTTFDKFMKKVKIIAPLSVSLASIVAQTDHPAEDFIVLWTSEKATVIAISSPEGVVKMARTVPFGVPREIAMNNPEELSQISEELDKEISLTATFFKQEFRSGVPNTIYFLGNNRLDEVLRTNPMPNAPPDQHFSLAEAPVKGLSDDQINENIHLIGNIFLPEDFNFLPVEAVVARKPETGYWLAVAALVIVIIAAGFWTLQKNDLKQDRLAEYDRQVSEAQMLQKAVVELRQKVNQLKPFEGWKTFYEDTFQNRPAWNMVFSELSLIIPDYIILDELNLESIQDRGSRSSRSARGSTPSSLNCEVSGRIRANNYEEGLVKFRDFGARVQSSPLFEVKDIKYSPEKLESREKLFRFSMSLRLRPQGSAHES